MPIYTCPRCFKDFSQKSHYTKHSARKRPCQNNVGKITDVVENILNSKTENNEKLKTKITEINILHSDCTVKTTSLVSQNSTDSHSYLSNNIMLVGNDHNVKLQKPFLKWVGGKTQMISQLISKFPREIGNYHEPFLGGGSVLLAVLTLQKHGKISIKGEIYAYDKNPALINLFKTVQNYKTALFERTSYYKNEYDGIKNSGLVNRKPLSLEDAKQNKENYYYWIRNSYNMLVEKNTVEAAAMFLFLNKTCFRGIYREGPSGFNVPYGHYKTTPSMLTIEELDAISDLIQNVNFVVAGFDLSLEKSKIHRDDFVYIDPPYAPENKTSFVGYTKDGFTYDDHCNLFKLIKNNLAIAKFLMSNAKVNIITDTFNSPMFEIQDVEARRTINSKNPAAKTTEVFVYNYK
jgi:DNA adenine methylase